MKGSVRSQKKCVAGYFRRRQPDRGRPKRPMSGNEFPNCKTMRAPERLISETLTYIVATSSVWVELEITALRGLIFVAQGRILEAQKCNDASRGGVARRGYRSGDVSSMEILNSRMHHRRGATIAIEQLEAAIADYRERDLVCRLRMELARLLESTDRVQARVRATNVFVEATRSGARPLAETAAALLLRLGA